MPEERVKLTLYEKYGRVWSFSSQRIELFKLFVQPTLSVLVCEQVGNYEPDTLSFPPDVIYSI